jgi:PAT family acetyl-CoA transporter-like MFS transporter 1
MIYIGSVVDGLLEQDQVPIVFLASIFTLMVFLCATQDIAVDGWAISLLTEENKTYASTAQTIGLNTGYFLSFTVFLAFNSQEFCNSYLRGPMNWPDSDIGILTLGTYILIWGVLFLMCNAGLLLFKTYDPVEEEESIMSVYVTIRDILSLPHMQEFLIVSLVCKIGWQAHESITAFKLIELGFKMEHLAMTALLDFPLQIVFGYYAAKWSSGPTPLSPWRFGYYGRLFGAFAGMLVVYFYPKGELTLSFFLIILAGSVLSNFASYYFGLLYI